jgi:tungstate transport system ATP-binding protein
MADAVVPISPSIFPLRLEDVSYVVNGRAIIDRMSLTVEAGSRTIILGSNGAGKSVLMRLCHGLLEPTSGRIIWNRPELPGERRRQAMVFQRQVMLRRSALGNITYALKLAGVPSAERKSQACAALERVGLAHLSKRSARVLSGGEQQRLALARAWALQPEVLFLDEPTASLDPGAAAEVEHIIEAIHAAGTKIVMSTHNLGQARRVGDEVVFLYKGQLKEHTSIDQFFTTPSSAEAEAFIKGETPWLYNNDAVSYSPAQRLRR